MGGGGGGSSGGGGSAAPAPSYSSPPVGNASDYYSQALSLLQPSADAQTAPLQAQAAGLGAVYAQKGTVLQQGLDTTKALYANTTGSINQQAGAARQDINTANMASQGQQRADAAARGFVPGSGVEQSAEANIQQGTDRQLTNLAERVTSQLADLGIHEAADEQTINNEIANLPTEQAADALNIASQIAKINGDTWKEAITMGNTMMRDAATESYRQFEEAMKVQDLQLAQARLDESAQYHQSELALRQMSINISASKASGGGATGNKNAEAQANLSSLQQNIKQGYTLSELVNNYVQPGSGVTIDDVYRYYNSSSPRGRAKETLQQVKQGEYADFSGFKQQKLK